MSMVPLEGRTTADADLQKVLFGTRRPTAMMEGPQRGKIHGTATTTHAYFVVPSYSSDLVLGPAPYQRPAVDPTSLSTLDGISPNPHIHAPSVPPAGTECLVIFVGTDLKDPWIVAFENWP